MQHAVDVRPAVTVCRANRSHVLDKRPFMMSSTQRFPDADGDNGAAGPDKARFVIGGRDEGDPSAVSAA